MLYGVLGDADREDKRYESTLPNSLNMHEIRNLSKEFFRSMRMIALTGVLTALNAGLVQVVAEGDRADVANEVLGAETSDDPTFKEFKLELAAAFGLLNGAGRSYMDYSAPRRGTRGEETESVMHQFREMSFAANPNYQIFPNTISRKGSRNVFGEPREVVFAQREAVQRLLAAIASANHQTTRFIIGKAHSTAKPGNTFDMLLGGYAI